MRIMNNPLDYIVYIAKKGINTESERRESAEGEKNRNECQYGNRKEKPNSGVEECKKDEINSEAV